MGNPVRDTALSPVNPGGSSTRQEVFHEGSILGPRGENITLRNQVPPLDRKASTTRKLKPQNSNGFTMFFVSLAESSSQCEWLYVGLR